jgi:thermitase
MKKILLIVAILLLLVPCFVFSVSAEETESHDSKMPVELLIKFKPDIPADVRLEIHRGIGTELIERFQSVKVDHVKLKAGVEPQQAIKRYRSNPNVEYVEAVGMVSIPEEKEMGRKETD